MYIYIRRFRIFIHVLGPEHISFQAIAIIMFIMSMFMLWHEQMNIITFTKIHVPIQLTYNTFGKDFKTMDLTHNKYHQTKRIVHGMLKTEKRTNPSFHHGLSPFRDLQRDCAWTSCFNGHEALLIYIVNAGGYTLHGYPVIIAG